jgi:hypothetical protein
MQKIGGAIEFVGEAGKQDAHLVNRVVVVFLNAVRFDEGV